MRRIVRGALPLRTRTVLRSRQRACTDSNTARTEWAGFRRTAQAKVVVNELEAMAGSRNRCYYCADSRGTDIDHFDPINRNARRTFDWLNMQWTCTDCNRRKAARASIPDLLDPTVDDPWRHFHLDLATGVITARYVPAGHQMPRGLYTLSVLSALKEESVIEGRRRTVRHLTRAVDAYLAAPSHSTWREVIAALREDDHGVGAWVTAYEGSKERPFSELRLAAPPKWRRFVRAAAGRTLPASEG